LYIVDLILTLGNKTLCEICNSKTMKKRHKKVEKEVPVVVAPTDQQPHHEGSGDHNETHVEEMPPQATPEPAPPQGEFNECYPPPSVSISLFSN
jgi:hypothetical protein